MERSRKKHPTYTLASIGGAVVLLLLILSSWSSVLANPVDDGDVEAYGRIDSFPAALIGTWVVDDITYEADGSTQFKQEAGAFAVGKCVKLAYFPDFSPFKIGEVETENDSDCDGSATETPEGTQTPEASSTPDDTQTPEPSETPTPDDDDEIKVRGIVDSLPDAGLIGAWVIDGVVYLANGSTEFEQNDGPFVVGACVEVELQAPGEPAIIDEIETEEMAYCQGTPTATSTPDPDSTPGPTGTPDREDEVYGRINSFPTGLTGDWTVNGIPYIANSSTEFEQEHGPFANGACVKLHVDPLTSPPSIREIETEHDFRCGNGSTPPATPEAEMYGAIQSFPAGLIGNWNIGGMTFVADGNTEFEQEHGPFEVGVTAKVHFVVQEDGSHRAREIETKFRTDSNDDNDDGLFEGAEGHAYGLIDVFPAGLAGEWTVSGVVYIVTEQTEFKEEDGEFAVAVQVKVEYIVQNGIRFAHEIETTSENGDVSSTDHARLFGYVAQMPASGFTGSWTIDGENFMANTTTGFEEEHGLLGLGAFVAVEYAIVDGQRLIHELETHVPPGAGPENSVGSIDNRGGDLVVAAMPQAVWTIGGQAFQITAATNLNDAAAPLDVGTTVIVNSYDDGNGSRVATQIRSLLVDEKIFLPVVIR